MYCAVLCCAMVPWEVTGTDGQWRSSTEPLVIRSQEKKITDITEYCLLSLWWVYRYPAVYEVPIVRIYVYVEDGQGRRDHRRIVISVL